jgi:nucleoid-associated protein YgaU
MTTGYQQAELTIDGDQPIKCRFNPNEYLISKNNELTYKPAPGQSLPPVTYGGGLPRELSVELLFDTADSPSNDVRTVGERLLKMMESGGGSPPKVTFKWGSMGTFKAFARSLALRYTHFAPDGTPVRAHASLTLVQTDKAQDGSAGAGGTPGGGNPTTRGVAAIRSHVVRDGDSLPSIAFGAYGDATLWRPIAEVNGIDDPLGLRRGTSLTIPTIAE